MPTIPYEKTFKLDAVTLGEDNFFTLKLPPRASIDKLIVRQETGALGGYTVDIYNKNTVLPGSSSSSISGGIEPFSPEIHKVIPTQTVANSVAGLELFTPGGGFIYENLDSPQRTNHVYALYMKISPAGSGTAEFHVAIALRLPNI